MSQEISEAPPPPAKADASDIWKELHRLQDAIKQTQDLVMKLAGTALAKKGKR